MIDSLAIRPHRTWWFTVAGAVLAIVAAMAGLVMTGAAAAGEVFDPGALVRWGLPVATVVMDLAASVSIGAFFLCAFVLPRTRAAARPGVGAGTTGMAPGSGEGPAGRRGVADAWQLAARAGLGAAVLWALTQVAHLILTHVAALGTNIGSASYGAHLVQFITEIDMGRILIWGVLLAALVAVVAAAVEHHTSAAVALLLAVLVAIPIALTGHAAGAANHELAVTALWLHVVGVAIWAGGLAVLCVVATRTGPRLGDVVERYSAVALWCFVLVAASGVASSWIRMDSPSDLVTSPYGQLLVIKIVLTLALGAAGWWHRTATIPDIRAHAATARTQDRAPAGPRRSAGWAFWRLAGVELVIMGAVIGVAVALGSSPPPVPQEPVTDASPAFLLTGHPAPPPPTLLTYLTQWRLDPLLAFLCLAAIIVYLRWVTRVRRQGRPWAPGRTASWVAGWLLVFWLTNGGPSVYGSVLLSGYVLQLLTLTVLAPILLVRGAPLILALRALHRRQDHSRGPREWLTWLQRSLLANAVAQPALVATLLGTSLLALFHTPLLGLTASSFFARAALMVYLLALSCALVTAMVTTRPAPSYRHRALALAVALACYVTLGLSITSQGGLLAPDYFGQMGLPWWQDALADQARGGMLALGIGVVGTALLALGRATTNRPPGAQTPPPPQPPAPPEQQNTPSTSGNA